MTISFARASSHIFTSIGTVCFIILWILFKKNLMELDSGDELSIFECSSDWIRKDPSKVIILDLFFGVFYSLLTEILIFTKSGVFKQ